MSMKIRQKDMMSKQILNPLDSIDRNSGERSTMKLCISCHGQLEW
jgi:hypothetical protein